jgi:hypothetical protein
LRLRKAKIESEKQEHEREASEWPANAHLECIVTTLERWHILQLFKIANSGAKPDESWFRPSAIVRGYGLSLSSTQLVAVLVVALLTGINASGLRYGKLIQHIFTVSKLALVVLFRYRMATAGLGLLIVALGIPVYFLFRRTLRPSVGSNIDPISDDAMSGTL